MEGRGREGEPIEWTGWVRSGKLVFEANPEDASVIGTPSARESAEVIGPQAAEKSF